MRNGKLHIGLVGGGGIGREQHLPGWAKVPFADVIALADTSPDALERAGAALPAARRHLDWRDLLRSDGLDAVDICTPNQTHFAIAREALRQGKHVLVEKPLATTSAEARALRDEAAKAGRLLMTAQHLRFDAASQRLKTFLDAGALGDIYYTRAQWLRRRLVPPRPTFVERALSGGGPMYDLGVHVLDLAYWFMGAPRPVSVTAVIDRKLAQRGDLGGGWGEWDRERFDVEDFAAAFVRFANGAALVLETSWLAFQPERELVRVQCFGTKGGLLWPDGVISGETDKTPWDLKLHDVPRNPAHHEEIRAFAEAVRDGRPSPVPMEQTLEVIRILEACYLSAQNKREVLLDETGA